MGYKNVCFSCRKTFSIGTDYKKFHTGNCPECNNALVFYTQKFKPPGKDDLKSWKVISFLNDYGFRFQDIYDYLPEDKKRIYAIKQNYPETLLEAKEFVAKFKRQALKQ
jgi:predicted RNA-binding Zn-ribbon protein involved in translation (DUF1610 family)